MTTREKKPTKPTAFQALVMNRVRATGFSGPLGILPGYFNL
ncbi:hypothetical protein [Botrimarina sp.]